MFNTYVTGMKARYIGAAAITMAPEGLTLHQSVSDDAAPRRSCATYTPFSAATRFACLFLSSAMMF